MLDRQTNGFAKRRTDRQVLEALKTCSLTPAGTGGRADLSDSLRRKVFKTVGRLTLVCRCHDTSIKGWGKVGVGWILVPDWLAYIGRLDALY